MSTGSWDPGAGMADSSIELQSDLLRQLIGYSRDGQLEQLSAVLSSEEKQQWAGLMQIDHSRWSAAAETLPDEDILHLIRFLAVAENMPGWEAGPGSPVIPLAKTLRQRGKRLDKPLLQWLREVNDNRFLPYGPL